MSAFEEAKRENWEKQRSILRVLTQIRENYTMAVRKRERCDVDASEAEWEERRRGVYCGTFDGSAEDVEGL